MSDRAVQFMPFAALGGYYDLIREKERVRVTHHKLTESSAEALSIKMKAVREGIIITVIHYEDGEYISTCGMVSDKDATLRRLKIVKKVISFDDILDIFGDDIPDEF